MEGIQPQKTSVSVRFASPDPVPTNRAYRIGQDNPVFVHKLLCQDTVEERIHKLQQEKRKLAAGILADADISNRLDSATMRALLE